jgi:hypothetical protein
LSGCERPFEPPNYFHLNPSWLIITTDARLCSTPLVRFSQLF